MLNKRENTPMIPREEERKSEQPRIDISAERLETDNGQDSQGIDFSITTLDGMEQLPTVLKVCVNAAMKSLAQTQNCWCMCRDRSKM